MSASIPATSLQLRSLIKSSGELEISLASITTPEPGPEEVRDILLGHLEHLHAFYGEVMGVRIARKHLGWYAKDRPENADFRQIVNRAETAASQLELTRDYFNHLQDLMPTSQVHLT